MSPQWLVGIDIGGTFTDVVALGGETRAVRTAKVPSRPEDPLGALLAALAAVDLEVDEVENLVHGTTRITNAIVEGQLPPVALVTTAGFEDVLPIARLRRRDLYRLEVPPKLPPLVPPERTIGAQERVEHDGTVIAAVLALYFRDTVLPYYAGATVAARNVAAYDFMYWSLMSRAAETGMRRFDFGCSMRGSGAFAFKKNWGFEPRTLTYQYDLVHKKHLPVKDPAKPLYRTLVAIWQRLPLLVANRLGPLVARTLY